MRVQVTLSRLGALVQQATGGSPKEMVLRVGNP